MLKTNIRLVAQGSVWFASEKIIRIKELMLKQCSATRSAYQAIHKHKLQGNDVKKYVKKNYMNGLNQRYVSDACSVASGIIHENAVFGGKKEWENLIKGKITKQEWQDLRNNQLYSRGDRTKDGNPNIRINGNKLYINDPSSRGLWIEGSLFIPEKFKFNPICYDVRLIYEGDGKLKVVATWEEEIINQEVSTKNGVLGIDTNPDGLAVSELNSDGNLIHHKYEREQRIQFAKKDKRTNDICLLAKRVVNEAKELNKPIVIEKLKFSKKTDKKKQLKKFKRMKHNFLHKRMLDTIKRRAIKEGVGLIEVEPAFTSALGALKYQKMYSLSVHNAAAMVIGRRGMGFKERQDFGTVEQVVIEKRKYRSKKGTDKQTKVKQIMLNLEGRYMSRSMTKKAWSWFQECFLKPKTAILTGSYSSNMLDNMSGSISKGTARVEPWVKPNQELVG